MNFNFSEYLSLEWVPTLGCTEPASIAFAAAAAHEIAGGEVKRVNVRVNSRMFKNCFAVGIPYSGHKTGIEWAAAIGSELSNSEKKLECFRDTTPEILKKAEKLIDKGAVKIDVETAHDDLLIDASVFTETSSGRVVIEGDHTNIVLTEKDSVPMDFFGSITRHKKILLSKLPFDRMVDKSRALTNKEPLQKTETGSPTSSEMRRSAAAMTFDEMISAVTALSDEDRARLREGSMINKKIAEHGLALFPKRFIKMSESDSLSKISTLVCAGVYARMWGEDLEVMSLAGSGNKGIVASVPISMWADLFDAPLARADEALALACLVTSATTHHLGTLSAVCGCSNSAGIGLAAGLVYLERGGVREINHAVNNMIGNVTGMICDGAKIGCALKTMTSVDAAFRAANLALSDIGIPQSDGIVGSNGLESLKNLERIAGPGMTAMDKEILSIMMEKLGKKS